MASARGMRVLIGGCANVGDGERPVRAVRRGPAEPRPGAGSGRARGGRRLGADRPRASRPGPRAGHRRRPDDPERVAPGAPARRRPRACSSASSGDRPGRARRRGRPLGGSGHRRDAVTFFIPAPSVSADHAGADPSFGRAAPPPPSTCHGLRRSTATDEENRAHRPAPVRRRPRLPAFLEGGARCRGRIAERTSPDGSSDAPTATRSSSRSSSWPGKVLGDGAMLPPTLREVLLARVASAFRM